MRTRAVFLDKDGTLIENVPYNVDPAHIRLTDGAADGLQLLHQAGYLLIVVTNQSGIAQGRFTESSLQEVHNRLRELLSSIRVPLAGFYYCPHHPEGTVVPYARPCDCRKPEPGMILRAAADFRIDLPESWMVGDILHDIEAGRRAGCHTVLMDSGGETEWKLNPGRTPEQVLPNLRAVAQWIIRNGGPRRGMRPLRAPG